jgi:ABC-type multidrug transport system permease subunit
MYTFIGQALVYATPNQLLAQLLASFLNNLFTYFNGFMLPYPQIPVGWKWMNRWVGPTPRSPSAGSG